MFSTNPPYVHPKMSGMPLGLKLKKAQTKKQQQEVFTEHVDGYWKFLLNTTAGHDHDQKRDGVYIGCMSVSHKTRKKIPRGKLKVY